MRTLPLAIAILAAASSTAGADDSLAAIATGGLVVETTGRIALAAEDLYLSEKLVRADYRFRNLTDAPVEVTLAFPMPDIAGQPEPSVSIPDPAHDNFLAVETTVDGSPADTQIEQRAVLARPDGGPAVDITDRLKALRIPLVPTVEATVDALRRLPERVRGKLADAGFLMRQEHKDGTLADVPLWTLKSKLRLRQVFPAGREMVVRQSFVPGLGLHPSLSFGAPDQDPSMTARYESQFCTNPVFERAAQALYRRASADGSRSFQAYEETLAYVLTAGSGWAGPIGTFRLTVDKGDPATLVSFCGDGIRKTGPTTFEMTAKDYTPARDIDVLFLKSAARG